MTWFFRVSNGKEEKRMEGKRGTTNLVLFGRGEDGGFFSPVGGGSVRRRWWRRNGGRSQLCCCSGEREKKWWRRGFPEMGDREEGQRVVFRRVRGERGERVCGGG
ncbi:hypothetical protein HAX54_052433 [Datura stramonium]|uniref:Uncharacterized protein n=1 Tax=Datura stramonium TaxID=4076 RepID=A0ABS8RTB1_DATST|nr:hypothetical protein [Datura stramonium]